LASSGINSLHSLEHNHQYLQNNNFYSADQKLDVSYEVKLIAAINIIKGKVRSNMKLHREVICVKDRQSAISVKAKRDFLTWRYVIFSLNLSSALVIFLP
jgi:hypothetical protein